MERQFYKMYIEVEVLVGLQGELTPQAIIYNGERYEIDRIIRHQERHHSRNVNGAGEMFVVEIGKARRTIYREYLLSTKFCWYVETLR